MHQLNFFMQTEKTKENQDLVRACVNVQPTSQPRIKVKVQYKIMICPLY